MPSAIDPAAIPGKDIQPDLIESNAATVATIAGSVRDNGSAVHTKWQGMAGVYSAPESGTLLGLMQPVSTQATAVGDNLDVLSAALVQFAADVRPIKAELDALRADAEAFREEIRGGVSVREINPAWQSAQGYQGSWNAYGSTSTTSSASQAGYSGSWNGYGATSQSVEKYRHVTKEWHEVQEYVDRNNELISAVNTQQVALWDAERACANKVRALYGAAPLRAYQSEDDALGYGLDEIPEGTEMPWGAPVERTEGCGEATANFIFKDFLWEGVIVGGIWGTVEGLGTLVLGYNPATGEWFSGDAYGAAWGNLGMLAAGLLISATPPVNLLFAADDIAQQFGGGFLPDEVRDFKDTADETLLNTGKALIAWDQWADDPGTALGESVFNVATILIPAGAAVAGVKTAGTAASVLSRMARVVDIIDPGAWVFNGTVRLGGLGLSSLDNLIGRLDDLGRFEIPDYAIPGGALDGLDGLGTRFDAADHPLVPNETYAAMDPGSALRMLDEWKVDLDTVTVRTADGTTVFEYPGGAIEVPGNTLETVRTGDGAADAAAPAPVREPELVNAGGARGEAGPGAVDSIVDETPVRTETGGTGESTVIREPEAGTGGSGSGDGGWDDGSPGGAGSGGGADDAIPARGEDPSDPVVWQHDQNPDLTLTASEKIEVDRVLADARAAEPRITQSLEDIAAQHPGVRMEGLEFSLKSESSFSEKVSRNIDAAIAREGGFNDGILSDALFQSSRDTVRYTYIVDDGAYSAGVQGLVDDLRADGYRLSEFKNSWGGEGYQGINSVWVDATGQKFEVQFHTDASFAAKMEAHDYYGIERAGNVTAEAQEALTAAQEEIFGQVPRPDGAPQLSVGDEYVTVLDGSGQPTSRLVSDAEAADTLAESFHNYDADRVMLGKYDGGSETNYIARAGGEYTYFDLGAAWDDIRVSQGLSYDDMFHLYNAAFLDDAILKGKVVAFSHNPVNDTGYLGMELRYLEQHGYRFDADTNTAYPPLN